MKRRYAIRQGENGLECVQVGGDYLGEARTGGHRSEEEVFGHLQATDGSDISTRKRHREYQKANGLTMTEDYKGSWEKAKDAREKVFKGEDPGQSRRIRESLERGFYEMQKKGRFR